MNKTTPLPRGFRKATPDERRDMLHTRYAADFSRQDADGMDLADRMIENAVAFCRIPLGIATGIKIDEEIYDVPLATEEPSVIAALNYAAAICIRGGGIHAWATEPVMTSQVFFEDDEELFAWLEEQRELLIEQIQHAVQSLTTRGGGFRDLRIRKLFATAHLVVEIDIDVRDAMGANRLNSLAETIGGFIRKKTSKAPLLAILSNAAESRRAGASFALPFAALPAKDYSAEETARRIVGANEIAYADRSRAVTHNKGIMNGISALALASGNDTRAIEAAIHAWASRDGNYRALTRYSIKKDKLYASIELPAPFAVLGGAVGCLPETTQVLKILKNPDAMTLGRIAAAVGLLQNFAALLALTGRGIQDGHMQLHARRQEGK